MGTGDFSIRNASIFTVFIKSKLIKRGCTCVTELPGVFHVRTVTHVSLIKITLDTLKKALKTEDKAILHKLVEETKHSFVSIYTYLYYWTRINRKTPCRLTDCRSVNLKWICHPSLFRRVRHISNVLHCSPSWSRTQRIG